MIIRTLSEHDAEGVTRVDEKLTGSYRPQDWETRITYAIRRDPEGSLVAEIDGRVVGFVLSDVRGEEFGFPSPTGWLEVVAVHPDYHRRDVGSALAAAALKRFQDRGIRDVRTLVRPEQPHMGEFFQHLGFGQEAVIVYHKQLQQEQNHGRP